MRKNGVFGFLLFDERFRDGLAAWTEGLSVEIKLQFHFLFRFKATLFALFLGHVTDELVHLCPLHRLPLSGRIAP